MRRSPNILHNGSYNRDFGFLLIQLCIGICILIVFCEIGMIMVAHREIGSRSILGIRGEDVYGSNSEYKIINKNIQVNGSIYLNGMYTSYSFPQPNNAYYNRVTPCNSYNGCAKPDFLNFAPMGTSQEIQMQKLYKHLKEIADDVICGANDPSRMGHVLVNSVDPAMLLSYVTIDPQTLELSLKNDSSICSCPLNLGTGKVGPRCSECSIHCNSGSLMDPSGECIISEESVRCVCDSGTEWSGKYCDQCNKGYGGVHNQCGPSCNLCENFGDQLCGKGNVCQAIGSSCKDFVCQCKTQDTLIYGAKNPLQPGPHCNGCDAPFVVGTNCDKCAFCNTINPCKNGASCRIGTDCGDFVCDCDPTKGWSGKYCENCLYPFAIDSSSGDCVACAVDENSAICNGGKLLLTGPQCSTIQCQCPSNRAGVYCEICAPGFYGKDCVPNPCPSLSQLHVSCTGEIECRCSGPNEVPSKGCELCSCVLEQSTGCDTSTGNCIECLPGFWGPTCNETATCNVANGGIVDQSTGKCVKGSCAVEFFGDNCEHTNNCVHGIPDQETGHCVPNTCICTLGSSPECYYGIDCSFQVSCNIQNGYVAAENRMSGTCVSCRPGFVGENCEVASFCVHGTPDKMTTSCNPEIPCKCLSPTECYYGPNCDQLSLCDTRKGIPEHMPTTTTDRCVENSCIDGFFGPICNETCTCQNGACNGTTGECISCEQGFYGPNCEHTCTCDLTTEYCLDLSHQVSYTDPMNATQIILNPGACVPKVCPVGFTGLLCEHCAPRFFGPLCKPCTCQNGDCDDGHTGSGECLRCDSTHYGVNCEIKCDCQVDQICVAIPQYMNPGTQCLPSSTCLVERGTAYSNSSYQHGFVGRNCDWCLKGYTGTECVPCSCQHGSCLQNNMNGMCDVCENGYWGWACENTCPPGCNRCDKVTGLCYLSACGENAISPFCDVCRDGSISNTCNTTKCKCVGGACDYATGACKSPFCTQPGVYGPYCSVPCLCSRHGICGRTTDIVQPSHAFGFGFCAPGSCVDDWTGKACAKQSCFHGYGYNLNGGCNYCDVGYAGNTCNDCLTPILTVENSTCDFTQSPVKIKTYSVNDDILLYPGQAVRIQNPDTLQISPFTSMYSGLFTIIVGINTSQSWTIVHAFLLKYSTNVNIDPIEMCENTCYPCVISIPNSWLKYTVSLSNYLQLFCQNSVTAKASIKEAVEN